MTSQRRVTIPFSISLLIIFSLGSMTVFGQGGAMNLTQDQVNQTITQLVNHFGETHRSRIEQGVNQVLPYWTPADGTAEELTTFCQQHFITDTEKLNQTFFRLDQAFEQIFGHFAELNRALKWHLDVDTGEILPIDYVIGEFSPGAHASEDLFKTKVAFVVLLNFPIHSLEERLSAGSEWTREQWAQDRLVKFFMARIPGSVAQKISEAYLAADNYIAEYNIMMHHVLDEQGKRLFPQGMKLITHWGLRDELKSHYADPTGVKKQKLIMKIMERIIRQDIPRVVINNPAVDWRPISNKVVPFETPPTAIDIAPEDNVRYQYLVDIFQAVKAADAYYPTMPTMIQRRFESDREIPEEKVKTLFTTLITSPVVKQIADLIQKRVGRSLEPFDIWYDGFKSRGSIPAQKLDQVVGAKYPSVEAFQKDLVNILGKLGFADETAQFLSNHIQVDPSRGAGHAMEGGRRSDKAHLRTRIPATGMQYKGFNIAIHELGHNVEQVFSLNKMDYYLMRGVPNNAFTEAFAFTFQSRDLEILNFKPPQSDAVHLKTLDQVWSTYEIAGVSLVDMAVWHWLYDHPQASAEQLGEAVIQIALDVWNQYYAPVLGKKDSPLLAIYSHMIAYGLYLPDYTIGHIIDFQIEEYIRDKNLAVEMERMCRLGALTPDQWMMQAVGAPISVEPMLKAAEKALVALEKKGEK